LKRDLIIQNGRGYNMKVIIADDSDLMRERIRYILENFCSIENIYEARNASELFNEISKFEPDLLLLDLRMPGGNGIEILKKVKAEKSTIRVVVLTNYPYPQYKDKCLECGADYFLYKADDFEKLKVIIPDIRMEIIN
jgi:DNA-binding NarL/FixJ family response regulator